MTILITGGTGKVGGRLAQLLHSAGHRVLIASRTGKPTTPFAVVTFDFLDHGSFVNPFKQDPDIDRVFLVVPDILNTLPHYKPFIDMAISKGVKRFVLLTSTQAHPGSPGQGVVHQCLLDAKVDYAVLRPTWFMQNFGTDFKDSIRDSNEIVSAAGDGRIPFISNEDIAQAAFDTLVSEASPNRDYYLVGPELYSYDEAVALLSSVLGRTIIHRRSTVEEQEEVYKQFLSPEMAKVLAAMEGLAAEGKEEAFFYEPEHRKYPAKHTLGQYFKDNAHLWAI
ncbi:hypothetical protein D9613_008547 [Agrocybe pediades]|uniref:NmrA-like domain-containing protein n=1 Tax=Agrocybe pediades TaxID=84607 RepID=A0A8H4VQT3_9AGAR|nr:hypothetical protein D9613_008547 [Agrocybe pediades]